MAAKGELLFPAINLSVCVAKSKLGNVCGCRHSLLDSIMRATGAMIDGKCVLTCGYGSDQGCAYKLEKTVCVGVWVV